MPTDRAIVPAPPGGRTPLTEDVIPREVLDALNGFALLAGGANVIMQLARRPIGHGVARSMVERGRVDRHPFKRLRTTASFLSVSMLGTAEDRTGLRREIGRSHAQVRSAPGDVVQYSAFDPELQLWVAACLYFGTEDVFRRLYGAPTREQRVRMLHHGRRFGTTLQMPEEMWPATPEAFDAYWEAGMRELQMDGITRPYLQGIATQRFLFERIGRIAHPVARVWGVPASFMTLGFLPEPFRDELGLPWSARQQRWHDRLFAPLAWGTARIPLPLRMLPVSVNLWDTRRRLRRGKPVV